MVWGDGEARACAEVLRDDEGGRAGGEMLYVCVDTVKEVTVAAARWWPLPVELGLCGVIPRFMSRRPPAYIHTYASCFTKGLASESVPSCPASPPPGVV